MKVSFIIPIYKVEKYVDQCIQSILVQSYKNFEILLVDDGSPDNCPILCDLWAKKDSRIKVFHKPNGGLSDARNFGLQHADGDYVVFIDGDDFWRHDDLGKFVRVAYENPEVDFIGFNCYYYYSDTEKYTPWVRYSNIISKTTDKNTAICELVMSGTFPMSAWSKFIKRKFLLDNQLFFVKGQTAEDIPWFINVLDKCNRCMFLNEYTYAYRQNVAGSITRTSSEKSFNCLFDIFKTELNEIEYRSFSIEAKNALRSFLAYEFCILLASQFNQGLVRKELYRYKYILSYTLNPKVFRVSKVYRIFGIRITEWLLKQYKRKL